MASYTKLFASILQSTVWQMPDSALRVWVTMLVLKDRDGIVEAAVPGLAHTARVSLEDCEAALAAFMAPDPYSRTPDNDGRRIEKITGGWRVLNAELYDAHKSQEENRRKDADRQARRRARLAAKEAASRDSHGVTRDITKSPLIDTVSGSDQDQALPPAIPPTTEPVPWHADVPPRGHIQGPGAKTEAFLCLWARYPNKIAEHVAAAQFQHFAQHHPKGEQGLAAEILEALPRLSKSAPYDGGARFWPSFERFLDERRWVDQPTDPRGPPKANGNGNTAQKPPNYPKLA